MRRRQTADEQRPRRGIAASELALILPLFVLLFVIAVDFGRVFYVEYIVINAARCGAIYGSTNPNCAKDKSGIQKRVQDEAKDFDANLLQIASVESVDSAGNACIDVTVNYPFKMVTSYLVSTDLTVASRIRMRVGPVLPTFN